MSGYDSLYVQYIYFFNVKKDYYECHEVLEELWLEQGRSTLYQGLLQAAVALYHYRNDNLAGAVKLFQASIDKLEAHPNVILGIDLRKFIADCKDRLAILEKLQCEKSAAQQDGRVGAGIANQVPMDNMNIRIVDRQLEAAVHELTQS